jgi:hypothetical protein
MEFSSNVMMAVKGRGGGGEGGNCMGGGGDLTVLSRQVCVPVPTSQALAWLGEEHTLCEGSAGGDTIWQGPKTLSANAKEAGQALPSSLSLSPCTLSSAPI